MNKIIAISREFGSGGKEIGKRLSDILGFSYYDTEVIRELAKETGMSEKYIKDISDTGIYPYAFQFGKSFTMYPLMQMEQTNILVKQQEIIKKIAQKGNSIIVGRGADVILKDYDLIKIFVHSSMDSRIKRCKEHKRVDENYSDREYENKIREIDKGRKKYYELISNLKWGEKENYNICINTTGVEIKNIVPGLAEYINNWFGGITK